MFKSFRQSFVGFFLGYNHPGDDPRNHPYAKACTPDQLIAAHIIESMAKEFDKWKLVEANPPSLCRDDKWVTRKPDNRKVWATYRKTLSKEGLNIECVVERVSRDGASLPPFIYYHAGDFVNGLPISDKEGGRIFSEYQRLKAVYDKAQRVAAEEKKRMEENEKKWNLAETLLGMKRNEQGALVPSYTLANEGSN